jgi:hypothetical protein
MFYVYRNTREDYQAIAQFTDRDMALAYMEYNALRDNDPQVMGYAVRDYLMNIYAELEK